MSSQLHHVAKRSRRHKVKDAEDGYYVPRRYLHVFVAALTLHLIIQAVRLLIFITGAHL